MSDATQNSPDDITFFKKQERIYPRSVTGRFRTLKWTVMVITLAIYYLVPFIRWDRGPNAPDQAVLIDMEKGRAYWFWFEIWPQEVYILTGVLIFAALMLFFVTSMAGRVWCGYFCFQTVWTDLFMLVERKIQGDRNARKKLREGKWSFEKFYKLTLTHICWLAIAWCTAGSFVLYFNDAPTLVHSFFEFDVSPTVLMFIVGLTGSTYLMAGFAREQVCTFMCPYARFQSAMFDKDTLIIGYDVKRGEPRGKHKKGESWEGRGHCINCTACVQVCPTGIDIRNGLQMECIACGLCADACDDIMDKVGLPRGLIRYDTERRLDAINAGKTPKQVRIFRPRTLYYLAVIAIVGGVMLNALIGRPLIDLTVLHDRNPLFVQLSNGDIRNGYEVKILNKTHQDRTYELSVLHLDDARITVKSAGDTDADHLFVKADSVGDYRVLVEAPIKPQEKRDITFVLTDSMNGNQDQYDSIFVSQRGQ